MVHGACDASRLPDGRQLESSSQMRPKISQSTLKSQGQKCGVRKHDEGDKLQFIFGMIGWNCSEGGLVELEEAQADGGMVCGAWRGVVTPTQVRPASRRLLSEFFFFCSLSYLPIRHLRFLALFRTASPFAPPPPSREPQVFLVVHPISGGPSENLSLRNPPGNRGPLARLP